MTTGVEQLGRSEHPLRLLYVANIALPSRQAQSMHVMNMCAAMADLGHKVALATPRAEDEVWSTPGGIHAFYGVAKTFEVLRLRRPNGRAHEYLFALRVLGVARDYRPDVVYSRHLLSAAAVALLGTRSILELHQPLPERSQLQLAVLKRYLRSRTCCSLVTITAPLREIFVERYGLDARSVIVAPDGAALPTGAAVPWQRPAARLQVGYLGHLYRGRGIELIAAVAAACPWADFHIVGGAENDVARVREEVAGLANVTVHGFVTPSLAESMRLGMDILLAPYSRIVGLSSGTVTTESWMSPLKLFEYMAAGKAIVCSSLPILRTVIRHEENGLLCSPDNPFEWIAALERLRDDTDLRTRLGRAARADLEAQYQWRSRAETVLRGALKCSGGDR